MKKALLLSLSLIALLFWWSMPNEEIPAIRLPLHISEVEAAGSFNYSENSLSGETMATSFQWKGVVRAHPQENGDFRCEWRQLVISDDSMVLIGFEEGEEGTRYWSESPNRGAIFSAFAVDLSHHDANNDLSLFQLPFMVSFAETTSVRLHPQIPRALYPFVRGSQGGFLINLFLEGSEPLPLLRSGRQGDWKVDLQRNDKEPHHLNLEWAREQSRDLLGSTEGFSCHLMASFK